MKISLDWLNSHLDRPVTADDAEQALMGVGFPIDSRTPAPSGDVVLDVEVTSNRPDCLHHLGVAREVSAALDRGLKPIDMNLASSALDVSIATNSLAKVTIATDAVQACPVYTARVIRGVRVGPSPAWLVKKIESLGLRSVNNVVDITNYVLFELGQPLHAFDLEKLNGHEIQVRWAKDQEPFTAIDSSKHTLKKNMLVIADASRPVAIAGVMGGLDSEVGPNTQNILLESAIFSPLCVRRTSRALSLKSDSSYRFERGIDPAGVEQASRLAVKLICELAGGKAADRPIRIGEPVPPAKTITLRVARCQAVLGQPFTAQEMVQWFNRLGLQPQYDSQSQVITCQSPTWRLDLKNEIDLIEEVARSAGYDRMGVQDQMKVTAKAIQPQVAAQRVLRQTLTATGYFETVNFSFLPPKLGKSFLDSSQQSVEVGDDRRKKEPMLRPSLLPSLLICRKSNQDMGNTQVRLFETASTWVRQDKKVIEKRCLALLADVRPDHDLGSSIRELKGLISELLSRLGFSQIEFSPIQNPIYAAAVQVIANQRPLGCLGILADRLWRLFELQSPVVAAEFDLQPLLEQYPPQRQVHSLPRYPSIERDLSVVIEEQVSWQQIETQIKTVQPALMETLEYVTTYRGKPIPAGKKSVTLRLLFRDPHTTLRHEQVDPQIHAVVQQLQHSLGAELRK